MKFAKWKCFVGLAINFMEKVDNSLKWMHTKLELFTLWYKEKTTHDLAMPGYVYLWAIVFELEIGDCLPILSNQWLLLVQMACNIWLCVSNCDSYRPVPIGWIRPQTTPTFLFLLSLSIRSCNAFGLKSTSPSNAIQNVFSAFKATFSGTSSKTLALAKCSARTCFFLPTIIKCYS